MPRIRIFLFAGRQSEAAVPHDRRGDAVIAGTGADRIPEYLSIHMGVSVHKPRRHHVAFRVHCLPGFFVDSAHVGNLAVLDSDVGAISRAARTVHHHAVFNDQIEVPGQRRCGQ